MFFNSKKQENLERIIIIGAGEVGYHIAKHLADKNKEVVVIDLDAESLRRIEENMDVQTVRGSGSSPSVLKDSGIENASIVLAVTDSDDINMIACLFANALNPKAMKLARIRDEEYTAHVDILLRAALNISLLVSPEIEIVRTIDRMLAIPGAVEYNEMACGKLRVVGMRMDKNPLIGVPLMDFRNVVEDKDIMVGAIVRNDRLIIPSGRDAIMQDDIVYFAYLTQKQSVLLKALGKSRHQLNSVCIVGGGNIGLNLAKRLEDKDISVKLIEKDATHCEFLVDKMQKALVLHGNGTDKRLLTEENIGSMDALVAVTGDEETNILSCLLGKSLGVDETVARVNKAEYLPLVEAIGIDHSVSPRLSAVNSILQYIRPSGIISSVSLGGDVAEAIEVELSAGSNLIGKPVAKLGLPRGALMLVILRQDEAFIPDGNTIIEKNDRITVLTARHLVQKVESILTSK